MVKQVVLILGMHRSGTSSVARVVSLLGAALPKTLLGQNAGNQRGHWESQAIIDHHNDLLQSIGTDWMDWRALDDRVGPHKRQQWVAAMADMITTEYPKSDTIVIKEPRICRFTDIYIDAIKSLGAKLHIILPLRNPMEVADSLSARDGIEPQAGLFSWLTHMVAAEAASRDVSRSFVRYDDFLRDPIGQTRRLIDEIPFTLPYALSDVELQISDYVNPDLKRQTSNAEDLFHNPLTDGWIADSYQSLVILTKDPKSPSALKTLDGVKEAYWPAIDALWRQQNYHRSVVLDRDAQLAQCGEDMTSHAEEFEAKIKTLSEEFEAELKSQSKRFEVRWQEAQSDIKAGHLKIKNQAEHFAKQWQAAKVEKEKEQETIQADAKQLLDDIRADFAEQKSALDAVIADKDDVIASQDAVIADKDDVIASQENDLQSRARIEQQLIAERDQLKSERSFMQDEWDAMAAELQAQIAQSRGEAAQLEQKLSESTHMLEAVTQSTSWRMTRGMRAVINRIRGTQARALPAPDKPQQ